MYQNYPLQWPIGYGRTPAEKRLKSPFNLKSEAILYFLTNEVRRLGATNLVVSTNLRVRADGAFYADDLRRPIEDPGVAIYFMLDGQEKSLCCDQYERVRDNMQALGKGIEAIRGLDRWGISEFIQRAFVGFPALPPPSNGPDCWAILGLSGKPASEELVDKAYRNKARTEHPDGGGTTARFNALFDAYGQAKQYFK